MLSRRVIVVDVYVGMDDVGWINLEIKERGERMSEKMRWR